MKHVEVKTIDLTGAALDWAVAHCEGEVVEYIDDGITRTLLRQSSGRYTPSTNWAQGGPIIEREWLDVTPWPNESDEDIRWQCNQHDVTDCCFYGPTPLIAAMRCYVAAKWNDVVTVPEVLL